MRFSILLPTVDRHELLRLAVASVYGQSFSDWELIISDNASATPAESAVADIIDHRCKCIRHNERLDVTDNWNAAMNAAQGDFIIMLGDDDALMAEALSQIDIVAREYGDPDIIFSSAWFYAWPGVIQEWKHGFLRKDASPIFSGRKPSELAKSEAGKLVHGSMKMRMDFPFNMQFTFMHRRMRKKIPGGKIYRSPYPDYFATNALFWAAERTVIYPSPATLIGISPKSYGNSHFKGKEEDGALLHGSEGLLAEIPEVAKSLLPGSRSASCFFSAMACLAKVFPELGSPDRASYRRRQIEYMTRRRYVTREISSEYYREFLAKLSRAERWCIERPLALGGIVLRWMGLARSRAVLSWIKRMTGNRHKGMLVIDDVVEPPPGVVNILDAQRWLAGKSGDLTGSGLA